MSRIAYVDESQRDGSYALAVIAIAHGQVANARRAVRAVAVPGGRRRRHFVKEEAKDRWQMLSVFSGLPAATTVYVSRAHVSVVDCRAQLLGTLVADLVVGGLDRLVLDHVDTPQQKRDRQVLWRVLGRGSSVTSSHEVAHSSEPLLWVPDAIAWCIGRPEWRTALNGWVTVIEVCRCGSPRCQTVRRGNEATTSTLRRGE